MCDVKMDFNLIYNIIVVLTILGLMSAFLYVVFGSEKGEEE
jgi:hypothetical protein